MFTHYSLFDITDGCKTIKDFEPMPEVGLSGLLAGLHAIVIPTHPGCCVSVDGGTLHPNGEQISFVIAKRFSLILMTRECVASHAVELAHEGNIYAKSAREALEA